MAVEGRIKREVYVRNVKRTAWKERIALVGVGVDVLELVERLAPV